MTPVHDGRDTPDPLPAPSPAPLAGGSAASAASAAGGVNGTSGAPQAFREALASVDIHGALALYIGSLLLLLLLHLGVLWLCRRRSRKPGEQQDGAFVMGSWPKHLRRLVSACVAIFIFVPLSLTAMAVFLAPLYCAAEGWSFLTSLDYVTSNVAGLLRPLTKAKPQTLKGDFLDIGLSLVQYTVQSFIIGMAAMVGFFDSVRKAMPDSWCGLFSWAIILLPLLILSVVVATGHILAVVEGWPGRVGVMYMASTMLGLCVPLTEHSPDTVLGKLIDISSVVAELACAGGFIGIVCLNKKSLSILRMIEGEQHEEGDGDDAGDAASSDAREPRPRKASPDAPLHELVQIETQELRRLQNLVAQQEWRLNHLREEQRLGERAGYAAQGYSGSGDLLRGRWGDPLFPPQKLAGRAQYGGAGPSATTPMTREDTDSDDGNMLC